MYIYETVCNLLRDSPHPIPRHEATSQLNDNKSQVTDFHKTRDAKAGNLRTN